MRDENYFTVQGWMVNKLKLKGNELILYAIIYGFSQDGESEYYGSQRYIAKAMGVSLPTANTLINKLLAKGLIKETSQSHYRALKKLKQSVKETLTPSVKETLTNNNNTNNNIIAAASVAETPPTPLEPFNPKEYIAEMRLPEKKPHIRLIGWYFEMRKAEFPSLVAIRKEVARWVKDASYLAEFDPNKIARTYQYVEKKFPEDWNLSTIKKYISYEPR